MDPQAYREAIEATLDLVRSAAHPQRNTLTLSPEVVAMLEALPSKGEAPAAQGAEAGEGVTGLEALAETVRGCTKCGLCEGRTQTVFGDGSPSADLVFVGEAPGEQEDLRGIPFVGRAGELLTRIIEDGMKLSRSEVYICNVVKCRPPNNRDPLMPEKDQCEPYLKQQLELLKPKVICALGGHAAKTLLKTEESTGRLRGRWHFYHGIPLRVTYHPAYLLRSPDEKGKTWDDIQEVMKVLNGEVTP